METLCDYVHLIHGRTKLLGLRTSLSRFQWSSWPEYLKAPSKRQNRLRVDWMLGKQGVPKESVSGRRVEECRAAEKDEDCKSIRRGPCLGDAAFKKELLAQIDERMGAEQFGEERSENDEAKAERIISEELKKRRWTKADLEARLKGDPEKVILARRLRAETVRSVEWIAERLHPGSRSYANFPLLKAGGKK